MWVCVCVNMVSVVSRCAMAIVHSRFRRVYFAVPVAGGALDYHSSSEIHEEKDEWTPLHLDRRLNHHFQAAKITDKEWIRELYTQSK